MKHKISACGVLTDIVCSVLGVILYAQAWRLRGDEFKVTVLISLGALFFLNGGYHSRASDDI